MRLITSQDQNRPLNVAFGNQCGQRYTLAYFSLYGKKSCWRIHSPATKTALQESLILRRCCLSLRFWRASAKSMFHQLVQGVSPAGRAKSKQ